MLVITTADLKAQTRRELGDLARNYGVAGWHGMKKDELIEEIKKIQRRLRRKATAESNSKSSSKSRPSKSAAKAKSKSPSKSSTSKRAAPKSTAPVAKVTPTRPASAKRATKSQSSANTSKPMPKMPEPKVSAKTARIRAQLRKRRETMVRNKDLSTSTLVGGAAVSNGATRTRADEPHQDRAVLLVRGPYWLQANWEITRASVQRAQSALAERWMSAVPMLRLLSVGGVSSNGAESIERDDPPIRF